MLSVVYLHFLRPPPRIGHAIDVILAAPRLLRDNDSTAPLFHYFFPATQKMRTEGGSPFDLGGEISILIALSQKGAQGRQYRFGLQLRKSTRLLALLTYLSL